MFFLSQLQKMLMYKTEFIACDQLILSDPFGSFRIHFDLRFQEAQQRFRLLTAEELFLGRINRIRGWHPGWLPPLPPARECNMVLQSTTSATATWCYTMLHRCHRKPLLVFATMEESSRTQGARLWLSTGPTHQFTKVYQYLSVSMFFSMNCYLFCGPQGDHAFTNFSHGSARESAVKKGLNSQAKEASLQDESVTGRPVDWFSWFSKHIFQTPVYWSVRHCMILRCVCVFVWVLGILILPIGHCSIIYQQCTMHFFSLL